MSEKQPMPRAATAMTEEGDKPVASLPESLPILPLRDAVVFPMSVQTLVVGRPRSLALIDEALASGGTIGAVCQKDPETKDPGPEDLHSVGTEVGILKMHRDGESSVRLWVQGLRRFRIDEFAPTEDGRLLARVSPIPRTITDEAEVEALRRTVADLFGKLASGEGQAEGLLQFLQAADDPTDLADLISGYLPLPTTVRQELLEIGSVDEHLQRIMTHLNKEVHLRQLGDRIKKEAQQELDQRGREVFLRAQLRAIREELGEGDDHLALIGELAERIASASMPPDVEKVAKDELQRLESTPAASPEHGVIRNYIEWLVALPWSKSAEETIDLRHARQILDEDHTGLEQVKERILEYLAVLKLRKDLKGPVLCLIGPPGVGKTSLGRSIARATGRPYVRVSLGGVRDEAEIRGHRRTYIGALPGRIIQALKKAEANNPVFVLDELDKLGADFRGDPSDALLEVLDPEQNSSFSDHYMDVPFDLSRVLFVATANVEDTIPGPLKDRLEVIRIPGYIEEEKVAIATKHLIPKQIAAHGLPEGHVTFAKDALRTIIHDYTRENGLRNLERQLATVCRKTARRYAEGDTDALTVVESDLAGLLGPRRFRHESAARDGEPGVATGLAWTPTGGEILFVEATLMEGGPGLLLTGQLGDVMKESAQAALSWILSHQRNLGIDPERTKAAKIHVHVPAGAVPKDGPSAGITIASALTSLLLGIPVRSDVAMTGEISLRGRVLPIGGLKEKVLAARRANIFEIVFPSLNQPDLEDIDPKLREGMTFHPVDAIEEVLPIVLRPAEGRAEQGATEG